MFNLAIPGPKQLINLIPRTCTIIPATQFIPQSPLKTREDSRYNVEQNSGVAELQSRDKGSLAFTRTRILKNNVTPKTQTNLFRFILPQLCQPQHDTRIVIHLTEIHLICATPSHQGIGRSNTTHHITR